MEPASALESPGGFQRYCERGRALEQPGPAPQRPRGEPISGRPLAPWVVARNRRGDSPPPALPQDPPPPWPEVPALRLPAGPGVIAPPLKDEAAAGSARPLETQLALAFQDLAALVGIGPAATAEKPGRRVAPALGTKAAPLGARMRQPRQPLVRGVHSQCWTGPRHSPSSQPAVEALSDDHHPPDPPPEAKTEHWFDRIMPMPLAHPDNEEQQDDEDEFVPIYSQLRGHPLQGHVSGLPISEGIGGDSLDCDMPDTVRSTARDHLKAVDLAARIAQRGAAEPALKPAVQGSIFSSLPPVPPEPDVPLAAAHNEWELAFEWHSLEHTLKDVAGAARPAKDARATRKQERPRPAPEPSRGGGSSGSAAPAARPAPPAEERPRPAPEPSRGGSSGSAAPAARPAQPVAAPREAVAAAAAPGGLAEAAAAGREEAVPLQRRYGPQSRRGGASQDQLMVLQSNEHAMRCFATMAHHEEVLCEEWAVFYHTYSYAALIYELQAAVAAVLYRFPSGQSTLPRILVSDFAQLPDAPSLIGKFREKFSKDRMDHHPEYRAVAISTMCSLVALGPEVSTPTAFLAGFSQEDLSFTDALMKSLASCYIPQAKIKRLAVDIVRLSEEYGLDVSKYGGKACASGKAGHLLQIFVHRSRLDEIAYAALPYGEIDEERHLISDWLGGDFPMNFGQARLVANPKAFTNSDRVRMFTVSADPTFHGNRAAFQEALVRLIEGALDTPALRQTAIQGIATGVLPSWVAKQEAKAEVGSTSSGLKSLASRLRW
ncbi:unnamed protein product [Prorocentrum cordatum]|uniref:Uncharacterized protein n=1 Tax=Prorocentrum cordatum TaxID=2364126 RepID=A0ABN9SCN8_9DINO|nr:unnamed protein product [Polarella glacialis]